MKDTLLVVDDVEVVSVVVLVVDVVPIKRAAVII